MFPGIELSIIVYHLIQYLASSSRRDMLTTSGSREDLVEPLVDPVSVVKSVTINLTHV